MKQNVGSVDRLVRVIISALIITLYFTNITNGVSGIVLLVIAGVLIITAMVGFCPLYALLGINSCPVKHKRQA
jgi:hypothetical protein